MKKNMVKQAPVEVSKTTKFVENQLFDMDGNLL